MLVGVSLLPIRDEVGLHELVEMSVESVPTPTGEIREFFRAHPIDVTQPVEDGEPKRMSQGLESISEISQLVWIALFEHLRCDVSNQLSRHVFIRVGPRPCACHIDQYEFDGQEGTNRYFLLERLFMPQIDCEENEWILIVSAVALHMREYDGESMRDVLLIGFLLPPTQSL